MSKTRKRLDIEVWELTVLAHRDGHVFAREKDYKCPKCNEHDIQRIAIHLLFMFKSLSRKEVVRFFRFPFIFGAFYLFFRSIKNQRVASKQIDILKQYGIIQGDDKALSLTDEFYEFYKTSEYMKFLDNEKEINKLSSEGDSQKV